MDYCALLASDAPEDEFEPEIREICNKIKPNDSVEQITNVIAEVFNESFCENHPQNMFRRCASLIKINIDNS